MAKPSTSTTLLALSTAVCDHLVNLPLHVLRMIFGHVLDFIDRLAKYMEFEDGVELIATKLSAVSSTLAAIFENHVSLVTTTPFSILCGDTAPLLIRLPQKMRDFQPSPLATNGSFSTSFEYSFHNHANGPSITDQALGLEQAEVHAVVRDVTAHLRQSNTSNISPTGLRQIAHALFPDDVKSVWHSAEDIGIFPALEVEEQDGQVQD